MPCKFSLLTLIQAGFMRIKIKTNTYNSSKFEIWWRWKTDLNASSNRNNTIFFGFSFGIQYSGRSMVIWWASLQNIHMWAKHLEVVITCMPTSRRVMKQIIIAGEFVREMRIHKFVRWIPNTKITDWSKFILLNKQHQFIHTIAGRLIELNSDILWILYILKCKDSY